VAAAKGLFQAALERPPEDRTRFLRTECRGDDELREEVESLLSAHEQAGAFAERPAVERLDPGVGQIPAGVDGDLPRLSPGTRLGPYDVGEPVGRGGMGEVYRARDMRLGRTVALNVLPRHVAADPERQARFEREARTLAALSHPHICAIFDVGEHQGVGYLVMEYLEGESLAQRLARGALPLKQALRVFIDCAGALDAAHRHGIVHRDLKPANIMLTRGGAYSLISGSQSGTRPQLAAGSRILTVAAWH
jgi:serine/threonine protein kinase